MATKPNTDEVLLCDKFSRDFFERGPIVKINDDEYIVDRIETFPLIPGANYCITQKQNKKEDEMTVGQFIGRGGEGKHKEKYLFHDVAENSLYFIRIDAQGFSYTYLDFFGDPNIPVCDFIKIDVRHEISNPRKLPNCDVVIVSSDGQIIEAHKAFLFRSNWFCKALTSGFAETAASKIVLESPHKLTNIIIDYLYGNPISANLDNEELNALIHCSHKYLFDLWPKFVSAIIDILMKIGNPIKTLVVLSGFHENASIRTLMDFGKIIDEFKAIEISSIVDQEMPRDVLELCLKYRPVEFLDIILSNATHNDEAKKDILEIIKKVMFEADAWPLGKVKELKDKYAAAWLEINI